MLRAAFGLSDIYAAAEVINHVVYSTPLIRLPLEDAVYAKAENLQRTHSFKFRGAYHFLALLDEASRKRGVVAHSSGNHAQGLACAAQLFDCPVAIAIPEGAPEIKVERTKDYGAEVIRCGNSSKEREQAAKRFVDERGYTLVPPFDHPWIIAGQGTVGLEIAADMPDVANVLVCVGGGGLMAGVALALSELCPEAQIIGVEPAVAADAADSFEQAKLVRWPAEKTTSTIADGVRTQSLGVHNFPIIQDHVDGFVTVPESAILEAVSWYFLQAKLVVEPTGALCLAAYHLLKAGKTAHRLKPGKTVLMVSGGNVDLSLLQSLAKGL